MIKNITYVIICALCLLSNNAKAQNTVDSTDTDSLRLIQFSGVVLEGDSLTPLPFASVWVENSFKGSPADMYGFFSFVAEPGDTVRFSRVGYKTSVYVIPDTLSTNRYSMIHRMIKDTVTLDEFTVYPWPSKEEFKQAFMDLNQPSDEMIRAQQNLAMALLEKRLTDTDLSDGYTNYKFVMADQQTKLYRAGGYPEISLLNPIAWAQFIQAWKNGDFNSK